MKTTKLQQQITVDLIKNSKLISICEGNKFIYIYIQIFTYC